MPDSNTIAIGSPFFNTVLNDEGKVKVFHWNGVAWIQKGNDIIGESWNDNFGWSISMPDTNVLAIGGPSNDGGNRNNTGHVRVYQWSGTNWVQKGLDIDGESTEDASGISISMPNENTLLIGAANNDGNGLNSGHARVFDWVNSSWIQRGQDIDGEAAGDNFGISVSMTSNNYILVGANNNDGNGTNAGHTRVYKWNGLNWSQVGIDIDGEFSDDRFGGSVSMCDSNIFVSGGSRNDGNGTDAGHVRVYRYGSITTSLKENYFKSGISIFPNPSKGEFFIELEEFSTTPLQILDLSGKVIREFQLISSRTNLDLTGLAEGVYFVMYGEVTKKLVITR
jgi:hypothetical protein